MTASMFVSVLGKMSTGNSAIDGFLQMLVGAIVLVINNQTNREHASNWFRWLKKRCKIFCTDEKSVFLISNPRNGGDDAFIAVSKFMEDSPNLKGVKTSPANCHRRNASYSVYTSECFRLTPDICGKYSSKTSSLASGDTTEIETMHLYSTTVTVKDILTFVKNCEDARTKALKDML